MLLGWSAWDVGIIKEKKKSKVKRIKTTGKEIRTKEIRTK